MPRGGAGGAVAQREREEERSVEEVEGTSRERGGSSRTHKIAVGASDAVELFALGDVVVDAEVGRQRAFDEAVERGRRGVEVGPGCGRWREAQGVRGDGRDGDGPGHEAGEGRAHRGLMRMTGEMKTRREGGKGGERGLCARVWWVWWMY